MRHDFDPFRPALSQFPRATWLKALTNAMRRLPDARLGYDDPAGAPELRRALASYLGRVRAVRAEQEQILITSGLRNGLSLVWGALAASGARHIAVESPGWRGVSETARAAGLKVSHVGLDDDGLLVGELAGRTLDAVSLAPAHQYPTGAVLSAARRAQLVAWARQAGALIVEDDYDA
ncbi:MAG: aminotransferase class I/II-fold pyridoxal phosphate-dependent enzyme [Solirubrobacteraceae bacterium]